MGDHISSASGQLGSSENKQQEEKRNKNVHFHHPQKQRTKPQPSQGGGASTAVLSPCRHLCQDFVRWRRHPRTLHDRTEDGEEYEKILPLMCYLILDSETRCILCKYSCISV